MGNKEKWLAWIAKNPIQIYIERAKIGTQAVAAMLLVSRQIVYRWLDGQNIPAPNRIAKLEELGITTAKAYAEWWSENPNPQTLRSKSGIDKERVRALLEEKSEDDPNTGCKIYCGAWRNEGKGSGIAIIRIGRRSYSVQHAAAWVADKIKLFDRVYVYRTCGSPACCNLKHIKISPNVAEGLAAMRKKGIICPRPKRGVYLTERRREAVRILLDEGRSPVEIAADTGVAVHLIGRIAKQMVREMGAVSV